MNTSIFKIVNHAISRITTVKYFGLYRNQFMNVSGEREIDYPAVLLEISPTQFKQQLLGNQDSVVNITLHVGMQVVNNIERGDRMLDNSLEMIELMDTIHDYMDGIRGSDPMFSGLTSDHVAIGQFTRVGQDRITNLRSIWYGKVTYSFPIVIAHKTDTGTLFYPQEIDVVFSGTTF